MEPIDLGTKLIELWNTGTFLAQFATLVLLVTQFAKAIISAVYKITNGKELVLTGDAARYLTLIVQTIIWSLFIFFQARGAEQQFTDAATMFQNILNALTPLLPAIVVTGVAASEGFKVLSSRKVPGFHKQKAA